MSEEQHTNPENFPEDQAALDRIIQKVKAPLTQKISALESEKSQAQQERDTFKQQVTDRDEKITGLESTVGEKDRLILVNQVAHDKKVPAKYLTGDSKEDLEAAADEFLNDVQSLTGASSQEQQPAEPGNSEAPGNQANGYVPSAGTGGEKPPRPTYDEIKQKAYEEAKTR